MRADIGKRAGTTWSLEKVAMIILGLTAVISILFLFFGSSGLLDKVAPAFREFGDKYVFGLLSEVRQDQQAGEDPTVPVQIEKAFDDLYVRLSSQAGTQNAPCYIEFAQLPELEDYKIQISYGESLYMILLNKDGHEVKYHPNPEKGEAKKDLKLCFVMLEDSSGKQVARNFYERYFKANKEIKLEDTYKDWGTVFIKDDNSFELEADQLYNNEFSKHLRLSLDNGNLGKKALLYVPDSSRRCLIPTIDTWTKDAELLGIDDDRYEEIAGSAESTVKSAKPAIIDLCTDTPGLVISEDSDVKDKVLDPRCVQYKEQYNRCEEIILNNADDRRLCDTIRTYDCGWEYQCSFRDPAPTKISSPDNFCITKLPQDMRDALENGGCEGYVGVECEEIVFYELFVMLTSKGPGQLGCDDIISRCAWSAQKGKAVAKNPADMGLPDEGTGPQEAGDICSRFYSCEQAGSDYSDCNGLMLSCPAMRCLFIDGKCITAPSS